MPFLSFQPTGIAFRPPAPPCQCPPILYGAGMVPRIWRSVWPLLLAVTIFVASGRDRLAVPQTGISFADKLIHFAVFGLLATLVLRLWDTRRVRLRAALAAFALVSLYGGLDEFRQSFTPGRTVEFDDWLADTAGACVAVLAYGCWGGYRRLLEWRPFHSLLRRRRRRSNPAQDPRSDGSSA